MRLFDLVARFFGRGGGTSVAASSFEPDSQLGIFQTNLGYRFKSQSILELAVTHKSCASINDRKGLKTNERLEFLGDSVINCLVTEYLFGKYPDEAEGNLSKIKSLVVSRKILGEVGFSVGLDKVIKLSASERRASRSGMNPTIVSNAFEAVIGALFLDSGSEVGEVRQILSDHLFTCIEGFVADGDNVNHKSTILEMSQRDGYGVPVYPVLSESGPDHARHFVVAIEIVGVRLGEGSGSSKKAAQQEAAARAIEVYNKEFIESNRSKIPPPEDDDSDE